MLFGFQDPFIQLQPAFQIREPFLLCIGKVLLAGELFILGLQVLVSGLEAVYFRLLFFHGYVNGIPCQPASLDGEVDEKDGAGIDGYVFEGGGELGGGLGSRLYVSVNIRYLSFVIVYI